MPRFMSGRPLLFAKLTAKAGMSSLTRRWGRLPGRIARLEARGGIREAVLDLRAARRLQVSDLIIESFGIGRAREAQ